MRALFQCVLVLRYAVNFVTMGGARANGLRREWQAFIDEHHPARQARAG